MLMEERDGRCRPHRGRRAASGGTGAGSAVSISEAMTRKPKRSRPDQAGPATPRPARTALLQAAHELFGQQGFEGTTIRDIGDRAGVDHALIARYYGSKADLYIAALVAEAVVDQPGRDFEVLQDMVESMVTRMDENGLGPVMQALIRSETAGPIRQAAQAHMERRMVGPMAEGLKQRGVEGSDLRAELIIAALIGIRHRNRVPGLWCRAGRDGPCGYGSKTIFPSFPGVLNAS